MLRTLNLIKTWRGIVLTYENIEKFVLLVKLLWFNKKKASSQFSYWVYFICHNRCVLVSLDELKSPKIRKAIETGNGGAQVFRNLNFITNVHFFLKSRMFWGILLLLPCDGCWYKVGISQTNWSVFTGKLMHSFKECYCDEIHVEV